MMGISLEMSIPAFYIDESRAGFLDILTGLDNKTADPCVCV